MPSSTIVFCRGEHGRDCRCQEREEYLGGSTNYRKLEFKRVYCRSFKSSLDVFSIALTVKSTEINYRSSNSNFWYLIQLGSTETSECTGHVVCMARPQRAKRCSQKLHSVSWQTRNGELKIANNASKNVYQAPSGSPELPGNGNRRKCNILQKT